MLLIVNLHGFGGRPLQSSHHCHVCVCLPVVQGAVLSSQVFDTYLQGGENRMAEFIASVSNGRILCFAIKVRIGVVRVGTVVVSCMYGD